MRLLYSPLLSLALCSSLQAQTVQQLDAKSILANLQQMRAKHVQSAQAQVAQTIRDFSSASATPEAAIAFYLQAVQVTQFAGDSRQGTEMHDWRKKEAERLKSPALANALRTCLSYMTLSMQRVAGATDDKLLPALLNYTAQTETMLPTMSDQVVIRQPVSGNIFSRWYGFGGQLGGLQDWEPVPGNIEGIYTAAILPVMRRNRDPRILQYWDRKIARANAEAATAKAFDADVISNTRKPELFWGRAEDMLLIGQRGPAISEMYTVIKNFPNHPNAGKWMDELQGILTAPAAPASSGMGVPAAAH